MHTARKHVPRALAAACAIALALAGVAGAVAANLGGIDADDLTTQNTPATRCTNRIDITSTGPTFNNVTATAHPATCAGNTLQTTLRNTGGGALGSGTTTLNAGPTNISLSATVNHNNVAASAAAINGLGITSNYASRIAAWPLNETAPAATTIFVDNFETPSPWTPVGTGNITTVTTPVNTGTGSGLKVGTTNANFAWKPATSGGNTNTTLDVWTYRPSGWTGTAFTLIGIENAAFSGYAVNINHTTNRLRINRITGGTATGIGTNLTWNPPENTWYRINYRRNGNTHRVIIYDTTGNVLATTSATDNTHTTYNRVTVRGQQNYNIDDITVTAAATNQPTTATNITTTGNGTYISIPQLSSPPLRPGVGTSATFNGITDNITIGNNTDTTGAARPRRSVQLWFNTQRTTGRQLIYEEGSTTIGLNIYLDGTNLYAHAYNTGWSNPLITTTPIATNTTYHVAVTLDATTTRTLTLYLNGGVAGTATKTDTNQWSGHNNGIGIAAVNSQTRFHDGITTTTTGSFRYQGTIDDVELYNSILHPSRITHTYLTGQ